MNIIETIKFLETSNDIDAQLEAFIKLNASATQQDLSVLLSALKSEKINFTVRELLAEPIINLAGAEALPELMAALQKNFDEGHDNDTFQALLADLAERYPEEVRAKLEILSKYSSKSDMENINWLLEYCQ